MFIRIWAFLSRGKLVLLKDYDGDYALSIARRSQFGDLIAERYWPFNIRRVVLLPDGTVDGGYVKYWEEVKAIKAKYTKKIK